MEQSKYKSIIDTADHYYFGTIVLLEKIRSFEESKKYDLVFKLTTPKVTLASAACEMYLKGLVYYETGVLETGYKLQFLFEKIDIGDQAWIRQEFNAWIGEKSDFDTEFAESIEGAFTGWRYLYEKGWTDNKTSTHIRSGSVSEFMELLHQVAHKYC